MAKIESEKERRLKKQVKSGFKAKMSKRSHSANITAEVDSAKNRIQEKDGAPTDLQERMRSALRAFQEGRKPRWLEEDLQTQARVDIHQTQFGGDLHETDRGEDLQTQVQTQAREDLHETHVAEHLQPAEPASWVVTYGQMWQVMAQQGDSVNCREDIHATQAREDIQPAEPASWVVTYGQIYQNMNHEDGPSLCRKPIMNSWLCSVNAEDWVKREVQDISPSKHMDTF
ncbi:hypothetical protein AALO_G00169970 [Alosa alosa]|uniref:Uncharacterized protein n=1 Tax=Alosa alosa TaxID=278164 RepID=A0AAV6GCK8_9TELE|nr:hypothetical protein AALO_G00169970 [Alosa alosa]